MKGGELCDSKLSLGVNDDHLNSLHQVPFAAVTITDAYRHFVRVYVT